MWPGLNNLALVEAYPTISKPMRNFRVKRHVNVQYWTGSQKSDKSTPLNQRHSLQQFCCGVWHASCYCCHLMPKLLRTCPLWRAPDGDWFQLFECALISKTTGPRFWWNNFGFKNGFEIGFRYHFDFVTCANYPFSDFFQCKKSKAIFKANFKADFKAKIFAPESGPCNSNVRPPATPLQCFPLNVTLLGPEKSVTISKCHNNWWFYSIKFVILDLLWFTKTVAISKYPVSQ